VATEVAHYEAQYSRQILGLPLTITGVDTIRGLNPFGPVNHTITSPGFVPLIVNDHVHLHHPGFIYISLLTRDQETHTMCDFRPEVRLELWIALHLRTEL